MHRIAIIRIAGRQGLTQQIIKTFNLLKLYNKNSCTIVKNNPQNLGMIKKVKDFVTWGEINQASFKFLLEKRGKLPGNKRLTEEYIKEKTKLSLNEFVDQFIQGKKEVKDVPGLKQFFRLNPPRGGFERKGTKKPYSLGGVLGYRKDKINELIQRMV